MNNEFWYIFLGSTFAVFGGFLGTIFNNWYLNREEFKYIKIDLIDELSDIIEIFKKLIETYSKTNSIYESYFDDLNKSLIEYNNHKNKFYLIIGVNQRKNVKSFYKDLQKMIDENKGKVDDILITGLRDNNANNEIVNKVKELKTRAESIKDYWEKR